MLNCNIRKILSPRRFKPSNLNIPTSNLFIQREEEDQNPKRRKKQSYLWKQTLKQKVTEKQLHYKESAELGSDHRKRRMLIYKESVWAGTRKVSLLDTGRQGDVKQKRSGTYAHFIMQHIYICMFVCRHLILSARGAE